MPPINTVLLDLDGTLVDTVQDVVAAVNQVLRDEGYAPLPLAQLRPLVTEGAAALLRRAFGVEQDAELLERRRQRMFSAYHANIARHSRLFDGMAEVLATLETEGRTWGIVTNKLGWLTDALLEALDLAQRAGCVISGDTLAHCKPHPLPMLEAARRVGSDPEHCVYVGDSITDIQAGRAAGMKTLAAAYGYLAADDDPARWGADGLLYAPRDLLGWLQRQEAAR